LLVYFLREADHCAGPESDDGEIFSETFSRASPVVIAGAEKTEKKREKKREREKKDEIGRGRINLALARRVKY